MWYQATIRYQQPDDKGINKTVTETYLIDAVSYTDAETRSYELLSRNLAEFFITKLSRIRLSEVFEIADGSDDWYKLKVCYITFDEKTQKEKKVPYNMLINASDPREAYDLLKERLGKIQDYIITDVNLTKILEVFPMPKEDKTSAQDVMNKLRAENDSLKGNYTHPLDVTCGSGSKDDPYIVIPGQADESLTEKLRDELNKHNGVFGRPIPAPSSVHSDPNCIFMYCPNRDHCIENGCMNQMKNAKIEQS